MVDGEDVAGGALGDVIEVSALGLPIGSNDAGLFAARLDGAIPADVPPPDPLEESFAGGW